MSVLPFSKTLDPYSRAFAELRDGAFTLGDITAPAVAALDFLGWVADPFKALAGALFGPLLDFLVDAITPVKELLDKLTGDANKILEQGEKWLKLGHDLADIGNSHASTGRDLPSWTQSAANLYYERMKEINEAFQAAADQAASVSQSVVVAGEALAGVREIVWQFLKNLITSAIGNALAALAAAAVTAGTSLGAFATWFSAKLAATMAKITGWLAKLTNFFANLTGKWAALSNACKKASDALSNISDGYLVKSTVGFSESANLSRNILGPDFKRGSAKSTFNMVQESPVGEGMRDVKNPFWELPKNVNKVRGPVNRYVAKPLDKVDKTGDQFDESLARSNTPRDIPDVNPVDIP